MRTEAGDKIVDWYMEIASDESLPIEVRLMARSKLTDFALREPHQTVEDVEGVPN